MGTKMTSDELRGLVEYYLANRLQNDTVGHDDAMLAVLLSIARDLSTIIVTSKSG